MIAPENASQLTELARWGRGVINDVAYSGNGRWIAVGTTTGVYIHDAQNLEEIARYFQTSLAVQSLTFSPDGKMLAVAVLGGPIQIWNTDSWNVLNTIQYDAEKVYFAPDGKTLAAIAPIHRTEIKLWRITEGQVTFYNQFDAWSIAFSPDGTNYAIANARQSEVVILSLEEIESKSLTTLGTERGITSLAFSPDTQYLTLGIVSDFADRMGVELHRLEDGAIVYKIAAIEPFESYDLCDGSSTLLEPPPHPYPNHIIYSPDGGLFGVVYGGGSLAGTTVHLYDGRNGQLRYEFPQRVKDIAFAPDGETFITVSWDGRIERWLTDNLTIIQTVEGYSEPIVKVSFSPDNQLIALQGHNNVQIRSMLDGTIWHIFRETSSFAFSPDNIYFAVGYKDGRVELRQQTSGEVVTVLSKHNAPVDNLIFTPDSSQLVSADDECMAYIWDGTSGEFQHLLQPYITAVNPISDATPLRLIDIAILSDGKTAIGRFQAYSGTANLGAWDLTDGSLIALYSYYAESASVNGGDVSIFLSDETSTDIAQTSSSLAMTLRFASGKGQNVGYAILYWAFSPDNQIVGGTTRTGEMLLWDINNWDLLTNQALFVYEPHGWYVTETAVSFSPNGRFLATGSSDGLVRLWGVP